MPEKWPESNICNIFTLGQAFWHYPNQHAPATRHGWSR
jgi:hypothetical protein